MPRQFDDKRSHFDWITVATRIHLNRYRSVEDDSASWIPDSEHVVGDYTVGNKSKKQDATDADLR